jgi:hypothetical protein
MLHIRRPGCELVVPPPLLQFLAGLAHLPLNDINASEHEYITNWDRVRRNRQL